MTKYGVCDLRNGSGRFQPGKMPATPNVIQISHVFRVMGSKIL